MKFQLKRLWFQILTFFSINLGAFGLRTGFCFPLFYCHACPSATSACPLRSFEKSVYKGGFALDQILYPLLILGFFGTVTGRAICGWACPIGLLQRATGAPARQLKKFKLVKRIGRHRLEPYLRYTKYFMLIGLVFVTSYLIGFMFTDVCPIGVLTGTMPIILLEPYKFVPSSFFWPAMGIFILFIVLIFLVERGWCRYFCPIGAFLAPFNKISMIHVDVDLEKCVHCNLCSIECPMGIDVPNMYKDPECILCGKCVNVCPRDAIAYGRF
jgi:polyferredoxin